MKKQGKPSASKKKNTWADHYTEKAKKDNYPARSVYKLMEIQKKFNVLRKNGRVLDLGCAPGSWLMYAAIQAGSQGRAVGIDLQPVETRLPDNAVACVGDIFDMNPDVAGQVAGEYDVVLSDMAPSTTGRKDVDTARSYDLCVAALAKAGDLLVQGGYFVCKIFQGSEFKQFEQDVKSMFSQCSIFKPESCRKSSKEIYIIGIGKK
ncbi:MAG: RlmE family RNA methyltransferase [Pseudomonadota bacterium]